MGRVPQNIFIHQSVGQLAVLEKADLYITHGGMNSVNQASYYKVLMLVVPMTDDQPTIGSRIAEFGLGTVMSRRNINGQKLGRAGWIIPGRQTNRRECQHDQQWHAGVQRQPVNTYPQALLTGFVYRNHDEYKEPPLLVAAVKL